MDPVRSWNHLSKVVRKGASGVRRKVGLWGVTNDLHRPLSAFDLTIEGDWWGSEWWIRISSQWGSFRTLETFIKILGSWETCRKVASITEKYTSIWPVLTSDPSPFIRTKESESISLGDYILWEDGNANPSGILGSASGNVRNASVRRRTRVWENMSQNQFLFSHSAR